MPPDGSCTLLELVVAASNTVLGASPKFPGLRESAIARELARTVAIRHVWKNVYSLLSRYYCKVQPFKTPVQNTFAITEPPPTGVAI